VVQAESEGTGYSEVVKRKTGEIAGRRERERERERNRREEASMCGYVRTRDTRICVRRYKVNRWQPAQCAVSNKAAVLGTCMAVWVGARGVVLLIQMILSLFFVPPGLRRSFLFSLSLSLSLPPPTPLLFPVLFHGAFNPHWHSHLLYSS